MTRAIPLTLTPTGQEIWRIDIFFMGYLKKPALLHNFSSNIKVDI
jgi:hypothetical protein